MHLMVGVVRTMRLKDLTTPKTELPRIAATPTTSQPHVRQVAYVHFTLPVPTLEVLSRQNTRKPRQLVMVRSAGVIGLLRHVEITLVLTALTRLWSA